ncbi:hypothetical protein ACOMHN_046196 [Nucella lapillus]
MASFYFRSLIVVLSACLVEIQGKAFVKFCYFPNWASQRQSKLARFDVHNIDPSLCTHLVYAFATIDVDSRRIVPRYPNEDRTVGQLIGRYQRFNDLKKTNKHLKTLVSIGGEFAGSDDFVAIAKDDNSLQRFAQTTVEFLRKQDFDGLDIDWEYPNATTKAQFSKLLKTLRTAFEDDKSSKERLLLTVALPAGRHRIQDGFDMDVLNRYVDLVGVMTYDYHGGWSTITGFDSPLFSRASNPQFNQDLSTEWTVNHYLSLGLRADRILVGITAAGTHFQLQDLNNTGVGAPVIKGDQQRLSNIWRLPDRYAYPEICQVVQKASSHRVFDEEQQVPYVYHDNRWFGYEDVQSIESKVAWMLKKGVAGAMFWALDMDDFSGKICNQGLYPLLTALTQTVEKLVGSNPPTKDVNPNINYLTREGESSADSMRRGSFTWILYLVFCLVCGWLVM